MSELWRRNFKANRFIWKCLLANAFDAIIPTNDVLVALDFSFVFWFFLSSVLSILVAIFQSLHPKTFVQIPNIMFRSAYTIVRRHVIFGLASKVSTIIAIHVKSMLNRTQVNWYKLTRVTCRRAIINWWSKVYVASSFVMMPIWHFYRRIHRFWCNRIKPFTNRAIWYAFVCLYWTWIWSHNYRRERFVSSLRFVCIASHQLEKFKKLIRFSFGCTGWIKESYSTMVRRASKSWCVQRWIGIVVTSSSRRLAYNGWSSRRGEFSKMITFLFLVPFQFTFQLPFCRRKYINLKWPNMFCRSSTWSLKRQSITISKMENYGRPFVQNTHMAKR